jgi:tripartite-type tricarboxylate transporter receptor subunit TctC
MLRKIMIVLATRLEQPFVIENRPGAGTNIATQAVVKSSVPVATDRGGRFGGGGRGGFVRN